MQNEYYLQNAFTVTQVWKWNNSFTFETQINK